MAYEAGMSVQYEAESKKVTITFRGRQTVLPGTYKDQIDGIKAGEEYCRRKGWQQK